MKYKFILRDKHLAQVALWLLLLVITGVFLYTNILMPTVGEDYSLKAWSYRNPPQNLLAACKLVAARVIASATIWSPRIGEAASTIVLAFPPIVFDLLNTLVFLVLVLILFVLAYGRFPRVFLAADGVSLLLITSLIFIVFPLLGQLFFWAAGAINHTWSLTLLLGFILPFRFNLIHKIEWKNPWLLFPYSLMGLCAGLTIENAGSVVLGILSVYFIVSFRAKRINFRFFYPLLSMALGMGYLLFSPATTHRRQFYGSLGHEVNLSGFSLYLTRFNRVFGEFFRVSWPLLSVFFVALLIYLLVVVRKKNPAKIDTSTDGISSLSLRQLLVIASSAFLVVPAMISIPFIDDQHRAFELFWLVLVSLTAFLLVESWKRLSTLTIRLIPIVVIVGLLSWQLAVILGVYSTFAAEYKSRIQTLHQAITDQETSVTLLTIQTQNTRILETRETLPDLGDRYARYFGFQNVTIQK